VVAAAVWTLAFTKLFIYDVDLFFIDRYAPHLSVILQYRFFIIIAFLGLSWLVLGNRHFRNSVAYVLFYPLVVLLWRIPKLTVRNWATAIVFAPAIESLIVTFKWRFIAGSFMMLAALGIATSSQPTILVFGMAMLFFYLAAHYVLRLRMAFQPSSVFVDIGRTMGRIWGEILSHFKKMALEDAAKLDPTSDEFRKKHMQSMGLLFIVNLACTFGAKKLQEVVSSRKTDLYFLGALVYTFVLTVIVFAFEYFALYQIQPASFSSSGVPSFWAFLLFSFNAILTGEFATVRPASTAALLLANLEMLSGVFNLVIFVFVLFTSNRERLRQDMTTAIEQLEEGARQIAGFIEGEYAVSMIEAEQKIMQDNPVFSKTIAWFGGKPAAPEAKPAESQSKP
jgi:hypothetical protein